jgi:hypothetical protein
MSKNTPSYCNEKVQRDYSQWQAVQKQTMQQSRRVLFARQGVFGVP